MTVFVALIMVVLIGFIGMAVDVGHFYVVKSELQNAADAGALAGAANVTNHYQEALIFVKKNSSDGVLLSDADIQCMDASNAIISCSTPAAKIKVTVSRDSTNNGGPVPTYFIRILSPGGSLNAYPIGATATAEFKSGRPHLIK